MTSTLPPDRPVAFVDDWNLVLRFLLTTLPRYGPHRVSRALVEAIAALDFPPYEVLATAVGHALFELQWTDNYRDLTTPNSASSRPPADCGTPSSSLTRH